MSTDTPAVLPPAPPAPAPAGNTSASVAPASPRPAGRGGRRPGAGAPLGNLNALKHGRNSRFRDAIPRPEMVAAGAARRLFSREQRIAERHAANLLVLARHARYQAECIAAVEQNQPLPPPPLLTLRHLDFKVLQQLLAEIAAHVRLERQRAAGLLTPDGEHLAKKRAYIANVERIVPIVAGMLDRSAAAALTPAALASLLDAAPPADNPAHNQSTAPAAESGVPEQSAPVDSPRAKRKNRGSIKRDPPPAGASATRAPIRRSAPVTESAP